LGEYRLRDDKEKHPEQPFGEKMIEWHSPVWASPVGILTCVCVYVKYIQLALFQILPGNLEHGRNSQRQENQLKSKLTLDKPLPTLDRSVPIYKRWDWAQCPGFLLNVTSMTGYLQDLKSLWIHSGLGKLNSHYNSVTLLLPIDWTPSPIAPSMRPPSWMSLVLHTHPSNQIENSWGPVVKQPPTFSFPTKAPPRTKASVVGHRKRCPYGCKEQATPTE
jgi:hypothetical protein